MPKGVCGHCGTKLIITWTKDGNRVLICPRIKVRTVKSGIGNLKHAEIWCGIETTHTTQPQPITETDAVYRYKKEVDIATKTDALKRAFADLTRDTDLTLQQLKQSVNNTLSDDKLLEYANLCLMLELPAKELPTLFNSAMRLGYAMGLTTEKAIESLAKGIGRQSKLILDNIGIVFNRSEAYEWYKTTHGISKLTDAQKRIAWQKYAIHLVKQKAQQLTATTTKKTKIEQLKAQLKNASIKFGRKVMR
jgi:hypothetical protein